MTIKIDHSAPPMLPRTKEPDLSKIVDQDILDIFKNTSVLYGDIINAQLIRTMKELVAGLQGHLDDGELLGVEEARIKSMVHVVADK